LIDQLTFPAAATLRGKREGRHDSHQLGEPGQRRLERRRQLVDEHGPDLSGRTLGEANFSGAISGALSLAFNGDAVLSGVEDYTGGATLNGPFAVTNSG
jgi:hypothetical protein